MKTTAVITHISNWLSDYAKSTVSKGFVIGISGGIDSAVVSTLCAMTKMKTIAVSLPLNNTDDQDDLSMDHGDWLSNKYKNVRAALCWNKELALLSKSHNNANIVCIPA